MISALSSSDNSSLPHLAVKPSKASHQDRYKMTLKGAFAVFTQVCRSVVGIQYLARTVNAIGRTVSPLVVLPRTMSVTSRVDTTIASYRIINDAKYFAGKSVRHDARDNAWCTISYNVFFTLSDAAASLDFLHDLGFLNLTTIASTLGKFSVWGVEPFQFIPQIPFTPFMVYTALAGYIMMGVDSVVKIVQGDKTMLTVILLARSVAEVTLKTFLMASGAFLFTPEGLVLWGVLGAVAAGFAVTSVYLSG